MWTGNACCTAEIVDIFFLTFILARCFIYLWLSLHTSLQCCTMRSLGFSENPRFLILFPPLFFDVVVCISCFSLVDWLRGQMYICGMTVLHFFFVQDLLALWSGFGRLRYAWGFILALKEGGDAYVFLRAIESLFLVFLRFSFRCCSTYGSSPDFSPLFSSSPRSSSRLTSHNLTRSQNFTQKLILSFPSQIHDPPLSPNLYTNPRPAPERLLLVLELLVCARLSRL